MSNETPSPAEAPASPAPAPKPPEPFISESANYVLKVTRFLKGIHHRVKKLDIGGVEVRSSLNEYSAPVTMSEAEFEQRFDKV
jgi:hypothetical protein